MNNEVNIGGVTINLDNLSDDDLHKGIIALAVASAPLYNSGLGALKELSYMLEEAHSDLSEEEKRRKGAKA